MLSLVFSNLFIKLLKPRTLHQSQLLAIAEVAVLAFAVYALIIYSISLTVVPTLK